ncbi:MAG: BrnA antitoxin family protein [Azospirillaceae bacterium]|nr:BrnA antitoxin family protein [Azospirillaceae bacterium]
MSSERITRRSLDMQHKAKTDWTEFDALSDADIRAAIKTDPDAAPFADQSWMSEAKIMDNAGKVPVTMRLDRDIVDFLKSRGPRYQTQINNILRSYVDYERKKTG